MSKKVSKRPQKQLANRSNATIRASLAKADTIAARAALSDVTLVECSATNSGADRKNPPKSFEITLGNNATHQQVSSDGKKVGEQITVLLTILVNAKNSPDEPKPKLSIKATYRVTYALTSGKKLTESELASFGAYHCTPVVWPYFSEFAHSSSMLMGLPSLRMPIFQHGAIQITKGS